MTSSESEIGYILKGFARTSETFITNEIYLLEKLGLKLSIFSLIKLEGQKRHAVVDAIQAPVTYLPALSSLTEESLWQWLKNNLDYFSATHAALFKTHPLAYLSTLLFTLKLTLKYREKQFIKEFLQAGFIAQKVLASGRIRHLHAHFAHTSTTVTMFASWLSGLPFSFTAHAKDIYLSELNPGDLLNIKLRRAKFIATCTKANEQHLREVEPHSAPIHTIYHGLDTKQFAPLEKISTPKPIVLSVGRFVEKKGYKYLVEACRILKERGLDFECHIVGGGDSASTQSLIQQLQLTDTIIIHSAVTQEELRHIYQRATVFALACQIIESGDRDGIPNVMAEAMAMELPIVSTDISGIPELVDHRVDGLLVPQKNAEALAEALAELLDDAALRERLGKAARAKICRIFDAEVTVQELHRLLQSCL
ncbi:MAG TPA: glycosyltransferase family 4 protein [Blastocatellia bacterium]|nr:glycosyltransferase family 4 protein [Blastocatellia bacterium]